MELGLEGRPALVAAASRGLGRACAEALAADGAKVAICSRDAEALQATRDEIAAATGAEVVAVPADVSTLEGAVGFVHRGVEALGGCQILVANAGGPRPGRFDQLEDQDFLEALELNFLSTIRMTREALPHMRRAGYGRVVVIMSLAAKQPIANLMLSNAFRAGVGGWARTLADEVGPDAITVNGVLPERVLTARVLSIQDDQARRTGRSLDEVQEDERASVPLRRFGEPREVGDLVAFLASERAGYLTGTFIQIDGGGYRGLF